MMKNIVLKIALVGFAILINANILLAGPGGRIVKNVFSSPAGRIILLLLVLIFLPLIVYSFAKEFLAIRKAKKDLKQMARVSTKYFDELSLRNRVTDVFTRVHKSWGNESVEDCTEFMSDWYWQNQQIVFLDKWKEQNLLNVSNLKRINSISPVHLRVSSEPNYEDSRIVYKIDANMEDYLKHRESNKIVEGKKGYNDVDTLWTFVLRDGHWKVDNIEQSDMLLDYVKMENIVPVQATATA